MGDLHKLLSMLFPQLHLLFPKRVLAKNERSNAFCNQEVDDPTASGMQVMHHPPMALRRDPIQTMRGEAVVLAFGKLLLFMLSVFVIQLVGGFDRATKDQAREEARFIGGQCGQDVHSRIKRDKQVRIEAWCAPFLGLIEA